MNLPKKVRTYREALVRSQQSSFVGREKQLSRWRQRVELATRDEFDRPIFNVSGLGGVGKSTLLRQFRQITHDLSGATAAIDETERSVPDVMGRLAAELEQQGHRLTQFSERYKVYRQRRQELESDPEAPQGFSAVLGRSAVKLARRVPGAGVVFDFVDEEIVAEQAGEWASYVARKLTNKDEVRLVQEPLEVLTPLFLQEIGKLAEKSAIALFFDTYERTGEFLDSWLQDLINSRYGDLPVRVLIVIAGREALDKNQWALYEGLIVRFPLSPFTDEEARQYLAQKGITDNDVINVILKLSGHLPLLVATLATEIPDDPGQVGEPNDTAIERFLKWVDDPKRRQVAIDAALPQCLNRDILAVLNGETEAEALLEWLKQMPFVKEQDNGWVYHEVVRTQMLRHKRRSSPQQWAEVHGKLADYYDTLQNALQLNEAEREGNITWQSHTLKVLYHCLCQAPQAHLSIALNEFLAALKSQRTFARRWAEIMVAAGRDAGASEVQRWGEQLVDGLKAIDEKCYNVTITTFTQLLNYPKLEAKLYPIALRWRGWANNRAKQRPQALEDLTEAIMLAPEEAKYWAERGQTYREIQLFDVALDDFNRAIELNPEYAWALTGRGVIYRETKRYDDALNDFNRAIELDPELAWAFGVRGETYRLVKQYDEALNNLDQAIELNPNYYWAIARRGQTYQETKQYDKALNDFNRAIELNPDYAWAITGRGVVYRETKRYDDALIDFNHAIEIDPKLVLTFAMRGQTYNSMKRYDEALEDLNRAIELNPDYVWAIAVRGKTHRLMKYYDKSLDDFNYAVALDFELSWTFAQRGQTYREMKCFEEALSDFNRAIELNPDYAWVITGRGVVYRETKRYDDALIDFNHAIEIDIKLAWAFAVRGETYRLLKQYDKALNDFNRAVELSPAYHWAIARRGRTYQEMEYYDEALNDFNQAIELNTDYAWAIAVRGQTYRLLKQYDKALNDFNRAIDLSPEYDWAFAQRGVTYLMLNCYDVALTDCNRAVELDSSKDEHFYCRALAHLTLVQIDKATSDLDSAIQLAQQDYAEDQADWNNMLNLALYHLLAGQIEQARRFYREALSREVLLAHIHGALLNLNDLLTIFPDHKQAKLFRDALQKQLKARSNST